MLLNVLTDLLPIILSKLILFDCEQIWTKLIIVCAALLLQLTAAEHSGFVAFADVVAGKIDYKSAATPTSGAEALD